MNATMSRRKFLKTCSVGVAALGLPAIGSTQQTKAKKPNIIIIMADDLGYGDLSSYDGWIDTPNLDRMANEGMKFTDYHASAPVCSPTRTALLTGRYQQRAGIPGVVYARHDNNRHQGLRLSELTFAEVAKEVGYATGVFGKWHVGYQEKFNPVHQGFDEFRGYVSGNVDYISHIDGVGIHDWWDENEKIREEGYVTHLINEHSVQFIRDNQDEPFCLYVAHEAPHYPFQGPDDEAIREEGNPGKEDRDPERVKRAYTEMVQVMDDGIGQILDALEDLNLSENTFVFFCSDNGAMSFGSNGDFRGWKGSLWEGGHRVPAIAWWPGKVQPGTTTDALTITMDIMPTIAELVGHTFPPEHKIDGRSLLPVILHRETYEDRWLFWEYEEQQAARQGQWKVLRNVDVGGRPRLGVGLFNLAEDPSETTNLADQYPERTKSMIAALGDWYQDVFKDMSIQPLNAEN